MQYHDPVLLNEVLENLKVARGKKYIDATLGDAGHAVEMLKAGAYVLGIDYDKSALARADLRVKELGLEKNFVSAEGNFKDIYEIADKFAFKEIDGILFDLGYSSFQLEEGAKGLSFQKDELLDMRLDKSLGVTAADLVNSLSASQLEKLFSEFGEELYANFFAKAIVERRNLKKFKTTGDLVDLLVDKAPPGYDRGRKHPATRVFQALRIVVNDELENLKISLPRAARLLKLPGGRMAIISFHSLEDRVAKQFGHSVRLRKDGIALEQVNKELIVPTGAEIRRNVRSRSAKMRVFERIK